jgi:putative RNA 2'-phosphotransferase
MSLKEKSKFLSYVLRHKPEEFGLTLAEGGWVSVEALMKACSFTKKELDEIVSTDEKKRYSFDNNGNIRANQGHSAVVEMNFQEVEPPEFLYHGTGDQNQSIIASEGIKKMNRQHVHLSSDMKTATTVGKRHGRPLLITVKAKQMYDDGCKFYCSDNGVWLTDYIDPKYFERQQWFQKK